MSPGDHPGPRSATPYPCASVDESRRLGATKDIWLMGGGDLIASLLDEDAVDELIVRVVPVLIGDGIPLIARRHREVQLALRDVERFDDGVVGVHYEVERSRR